MSVTYTVTDSTGTTHTRTSRRHTLPIYTHCVVRKPGDAEKRFVSFHAGRDRAAKVWAKDRSVLGYQSTDLLWPNAELLEVTAR